MGRLSTAERSAILARMTVKPIVDAAATERDRAICLADIVARPSITRSDSASKAFTEAGLGLSALIERTRAQCDAMIIISRPVRDAAGNYKRHETIEIPDWRAREAAHARLERIHGWQYSPQKSQDIPPIVLWLQQLPVEARERVESIIRDRLMPLVGAGGGNRGN